MPITTINIKTYIILLTQAETSAPTKKVLQNTLNITSTLTRITTGQYQAVLSKSLDRNLTTIMIQPIQGNGGTTQAFFTADDTIAIQTSVGGAYLDTLLLNTALEIKLYSNPQHQ